MIIEEHTPKHNWEQSWVVTHIHKSGDMSDFKDVELENDKTNVPMEEYELTLYTEQLRLREDPSITMTFDTEEEIDKTYNAAKRLVSRGVVVSEEDVRACIESEMGEKRGQ